MVVTSKVESGQLADLVKQVQAGNEVLLTQGDKTVARLVPAHAEKSETLPPLTFRSLKGHKVLTSAISQAEIAEEMFGRE
jgi:antitoxin (DNA-binding transcriptional repressor) of toxin-antitoxin stability system